MKYIDTNEFKLSNTCVAFGNFNGLHTGHRAVIDTVLRISLQKALTSVIVSIECDESCIEGRSILTTPEEKKYLLQKNGPEVLISYKTDVPNIDVKRFIKEIIVDRLDAKVVVAGSVDKNIELLRECAKEYGFSLEECEPVLYDGEPVTSERILAELDQGSLQKANEMLGYPYLIIGEVMHGKALGRTVGLPTANIGYKPYKQLPSDGVFGTISDIDGKKFKGLTNLGHRPTVDNFDYVTVEAFLLDFSDDIYGKMITLEVHAHIRGIRKFKDLAEVRVQVDKDIESIRSYFDQLA